MADAQDLGAMVTAGLAAREVERGTGGSRHHDAADHGCANCGTALVGEYCHTCGQMGHVHKTAGAFFHDVAHGVFHFEGKVWHTLPLLLFKPGELTRRYIDGQRARFVSPMALFLFSVFLMFASLGLFGQMDLGGRSLTAVNADLVQQQAKARDRIASLTRRRAEAVEEGNRADVADYDRRLAEVRTYLQSVTTARKTLAGDAAGRGGGLDINTGSAKLDEKVKHALANPELALYKLKTAAYKYSWALIPLSLPFIWLLFPFSRRFGFYDHAIFATYSLSFMTLLVVAVSLLVYAGATPGVVVFAAMLIAPFHMYKQVKGTYLLGRWNGLARTSLLLFFTFFTILLFALLLGYLGLA